MIKARSRNLAPARGGTAQTGGIDSPLDVTAADSMRGCEACVSIGLFPIFPERGGLLPSEKKQMS